jgi:hypothetical protein
MRILAVVLVAAGLAAPARAQVPASAPEALAPRIRVMIPGCRPADFDPDAFLAALQVELASRLLTIDLTTPEEAWEREEDGPQAAAALVLRFPACDTTRALIVLRDRVRRQVHRRAMELRDLAPSLRPRAIALGVAEMLRVPAQARAAATRPAPLPEAPPPNREVTGPAWPAPRPPGLARWWIGFGLGAGVGSVSGYSECAWNEGPQSDGRNYSGFCVRGLGAHRTKLASGTGTTPLHLAPEVGYYLTAHWALSLQGRFQVLTLADKGAAKTAEAALLRAAYVFGTERIRPYAMLGVGGGWVRHRVNLGKVATLAEDPAISQRDIVDTVRAGPFLLTFGGGLRFAVHRHFGLQAELSVLVAEPDPTVHADLHVGVYAAF